MAIADKSLCFIHLTVDLIDHRIRLDHVVSLITYFVAVNGVTKGGSLSRYKLTLTANDVSISFCSTFGCTMGMSGMSL